jgi:microcompartment protein CcmL/EutN
VEEAIGAGEAVSGHALADQVFLPDVHPDVVAALRGRRVAEQPEALGIVETDSVAMTLEAADAGIKGAAVELLEVHLADGLGGRAYLLFGGSVADVEAAVAVGSSRVPEQHLVATSVISQLHSEMAGNLMDHPRFSVRTGREGPDAAR